MGLALQDAVPDAKTIWLYREQLTRAGALTRLFARFDAVLAERGFPAMGGQIVDATVVEARRPRLTHDEKQTLRDGGTPEGWPAARTRQIDADGRWTPKRGRKAKPPEGAPRQAVAEIAVPMFGDKNHLGIDRAHGSIRRFVVTDAARHDSAERGAVLDPGNTGSGVWADTAYRSKTNLDLPDRRGRRAEFQRAKPRRRPMPAHILRGNATRAPVRGLVEHVFAAQKRRMGLVVRCIGLARATARITLANLAYTMRRLAWIEGRAAPAWPIQAPHAPHRTPRGGRSGLQHRRSARNPTLTTPHQRPMSRFFEVSSRPPSTRAIRDLPPTGDRPGSGGVASTGAGMVSASGWF